MEAGVSYEHIPFGDKGNKNESHVSKSDLSTFLRLVAGAALAQKNQLNIYNWSDNPPRE